MGKDAIEMNAVVKECFTNHFKVVCDNGHEVIAIMRRAQADLAPQLTVGSCVTLSLSPQDFSQGWIVAVDPAATADP